MKFAQLVVYKIRNIFVEKSYTKCDGETVPRPFSKKPKLSIPLHQKSKVLEISKYIETKFQTTYF